MKRKFILGFSSLALCLALGAPSFAAEQSSYGAKGTTGATGGADSSKPAGESAGAMTGSEGKEAAAGKTASSKDVSKLKDELRKESNISQTDADALTPHLSEFIQRSTNTQLAKDLASSSVQNNCTGSCLATMFQELNRTMAKGIPDKDAEGIVAQALKEQVRERDRLKLSDQEFASRVQASVNQRIEQHMGAAPGKTPEGGMTEPAK